MGVIREPLGERIETDHGQCHRGEIKAQTIYKRACHNKSGGGEQTEHCGTENRYTPGGQMPLGSTGIKRIHFTINDAVKCHGACPGKDDAKNDAAEDSAPWPTAMISCRDQHRRQGKRQRKDSMRKSHERTPFLNRRKHFNKKIGVGITLRVAEIMRRSTQIGSSFQTTKPAIDFLGTNALKMPFSF
jgi:hypothetical protein